MIWTTSILSCCLFLGATLSASEAQTGIEGVITVGPVNGGPARIGILGSKPLVNAGHYIVSLKDKKGGIGHYGPFEVDVVADRMTKVEWRCDTGIR